MIYWTWTRFGISWHPLYWPTWKGWLVDFRANAPMQWRPDLFTHPDNVLPWSTTTAGAVEPDQTNLIFSLTFEQQCVAILPGRWESGIRGDMEGYLQSLPSSGRRGSAPFLWLFPFLWREGIRTVLKPSLSPIYPSKGPHIKAKIGQRPPEIVYIWHI